MMANNWLHQQRGLLNRISERGVGLRNVYQVCNGLKWRVIDRCGRVMLFIRNDMQRFCGFVCAKKRQWTILRISYWDDQYWITGLPTNNQIRALYFIYSNLNLFAPIFRVNRRKVTSSSWLSAYTLPRGKFHHLHTHISISFNLL